MIRAIGHSLWIGSTPVVQGDVRRFGGERKVAYHPLEALDIMSFGVR